MYDITQLYDEREAQAERDEFSQWLDERRAQHIALMEGDLARYRATRLARHTPLVATVTDDTDGIVWGTGVWAW